MDKTQLRKYISEILSEKISGIEKLIENIRASNNDTKSSMGDKYETSREMLPQEINRLMSQLSELIKQKSTLDKIRNEENKRVALGSYVETTNGNFYISIGLGQINFKTKSIFIISSQTPLVKGMMGKSSGELFFINGNEYRILTVH